MRETRRHNMAEDATTGTAGDAQGDTYCIVSVPDDQAEKVIEFVAGLQSKDADVAGHLLSGGGLMGGLGGGGLSAKQSTNTGCTQTFKKGQAGFDWSCDDTDTLIT